MNLRFSETFFFTIATGSGFSIHTDKTVRRDNLKNWDYLKVIFVNCFKDIIVETYKGRDSKTELDGYTPGTQLQCQNLAVENSKLLHQFSLSFCVHFFPLPVVFVMVIQQKLGYINCSFPPHQKKFSLPL